MREVPGPHQLDPGETVGLIHGVPGGVVGGAHLLLALLDGDFVPYLLQFRHVGLQLVVPAGHQERHPAEITAGPGTNG